MRIFSLLLLSTVAVLAMDGDEKTLSEEPITLKHVSSTFKDSIEDAIDKFVRSEEAREVEKRLEKRQLAAHKKSLAQTWNVREMLADIRKKEIDFQLQDADSLNRLIASTSGLHVQKLPRRPQTGFKPRFGGK